jgi:hypothetical protein
VDNQESKRIGALTRLKVFRPSLILLLSVFALSCNDSLQLFQPHPEPTEFRHEVFPLAIGNSWNYIDSLGSYAYPRTDSITRFRVAGDMVWWTMNWYLCEYADKDGNTLYLPYNGQSYTRYVPTPALGDTVRLSWQIPDADQVICYALAGAFTVPAGKFDSCAVYEYSSSWSRYRYIFKPGIGVLYSETLSKSDQSYAYRSFLVLCTLAQ